MAFGRGSGSLSPCPREERADGRRGRSEYREALRRTHSERGRLVLFSMMRVTASAGVACYLIAAATCMCGCEKKQSNTNPHAQSIEQAVKSLVSVGMSEGEVIDALDRAGVRRGEIVQPVRGGKYSQMHVPIVGDIGGAAAAEYAVTGTNRAAGKKVYVIIEFDENGIVTKIE